MDNFDNTNQPEDLNNEYLNAWAKDMMNMSDEFTDSEQKAYDIVNAYTHTTQNTGVLIPETVAEGIFEQIEEQNAFYQDIKKYNVNGKLSIKKHVGVTAGDAKAYKESEQTVDEENQFAEVTLDGFDIAKLVKVSWRLKAMAIEDFISFITDELADRIGKALGEYVINGNGTSEPEGVVASAPNTQKVDGSGGGGQSATPPKSLQAVTDIIGKVQSGYHKGSKFYVNSKTLYTVLLNMTDSTGRPLFQQDLTGQLAGRILGFPVKVDGAVADNTLLFGNAKRGYVGNTNEPLNIQSQDDLKSRETHYSGFMVFDGKVVDHEAFGILTNADQTK